MSDPFYKSADWLAIRKRQLARQPICESCERAPAEHVDHRTAISAGGARRDPRNLQSLCESCHNEKSATEKHGRTWTPQKHKGCDARGMPNDPAHPWHQLDDGDPHLIEVVQDAGGVHSLRSATPDRRRPQKQT